MRRRNSEANQIRFAAGDPPAIQDAPKQKVVKGVFRNGERVYYPR